MKKNKGFQRAGSGLRWPQVFTQEHRFLWCKILCQKQKGRKDFGLTFQVKRVSFSLMSEDPTQISLRTVLEAVNSISVELHNFRKEMDSFREQVEIRLDKIHSEVKETHSELYSLRAEFRELRSEFNEFRSQFKQPA